MWPLARTDDVLSAFYVADEGRADPVGVATSLAKGARQLGVAIVEGVTATGVATRGRQVTAVLTSAGRIETEVVVNAAGMWARQFGALAGVGVPLQAAEHYYLLTDTVPGMDPDLPVIEDPDNYGYYRPEGDGMLVGLFEPVAAPWSLDGVPDGFSFGKISPDWERMEPFLGPALDRIPVLSEIGRADLLLRAGVVHRGRPAAARPRPRAGRVLRRGGPELARHPVRRRGRQHARALDRGRGAAGRRDQRRHRPDARRTRRPAGSGPSGPWSSWGCCSGTRSGRPGSRPPGGTCAARCCTTGWPRRAGTSPPRRAGSSPSGTRRGRSEPATRLGYRLAWIRACAAHEVVGREHAAVREAAGLLDMSLMAKFLVQGPGAAAVLSRLSANDVTARLGRLVYTQWLNEAGGIVADVTVTWLEPDKFLVIASDLIHRRIEPLIRRATRPGEFLTVTDVTSGTTLLSVQGPASRTLIGRLTDADLSNGSFPYLSARQIHVGYAPVLAIRVTYVGELGWELHVPAEYAMGVYDDLVSAGGDLGFRLVGLSAMSSLRLEKGYRDMGVDIDNTDNPLEAGLGFAVAWDKPGGFTGRKALLVAREQGPPRHRVVSLLAEDPAADLFGNEPVFLGDQWVGYVRAAAYGYTVGGAVGLAQVESAEGVTGGWLKNGDFRARTPAGDVPVRLQIAPLYDPQRLRILDR